MAQPINSANLDAVIAIASGSAVDTRGHVNVEITCIVTSVTTGGTVLTQISPDNTNWITVHTASFIASATSNIVFSGRAIRYVRTRLSAVTDGTFTTYITLTGNADVGF